MQKFSALLKQKIALTSEVYQLSFSKPEKFSYLAGQFVQWLVPVNGKDITRSYSLSSVPDDSDIEFCVKIIPDGKASRLIQIMNEGDSLKFRAPQGRFVCSETNLPLFAIATGVGLAPIIGIIRDCLENKKMLQKIHLLFGVRCEKDIFWWDRLKKLAATFPHFSYTITLSQPTDSWMGYIGRVTEHLFEHPQKNQYFLCGSMKMVKDARQRLIVGGADSNMIHFEIF